jgi:hypothetical protein
MAGAKWSISGGVPGEEACRGPGKRLVRSCPTRSCSCLCYDLAISAPDFHINRRISRTCSSVAARFMNSSAPLFIRSHYSEQFFTIRGPVAVNMDQRLRLHGRDAITGRGGVQRYRKVLARRKRSTGDSWTYASTAPNSTRLVHATDSADTSSCKTLHRLDGQNPSTAAQPSRSTRSDELLQVMDGNGSRTVVKTGTRIKPSRRAVSNNGGC